MIDYLQKGLIINYYYSFSIFNIFNFNYWIAVKLQCWNTTEITAWMQQQGLTTLNEVFNYYQQQIYGFANKYGKVPVNWQEVFDSNLTLPSNIIVQVWQEYDSSFLLYFINH